MTITAKPTTRWIAARAIMLAWEERTTDRTTWARCVKIATDAVDDAAAEAGVDSTALIANVARKRVKSIMDARARQYRRVAERRQYVAYDYLRLLGLLRA